VNKEKTETCGKRIEKALAIRNMKQSQLCKLADVPKSSLCLYLKGDYEPKQDKILRMANVLNVSESWLMGYDVPMENGDFPAADSSLTKSEEIMLGLFRRIPESQQEMLISAIRGALGTRE
jgi:transcriptional regulator with XRE-family HTH domain